MSRTRAPVGAEPLTVCAPLRAEAARLRRSLPQAAVYRCGAGPRRAAAAARSAALAQAPALAVAGIGAGLSPEVRPGDVVVATQVCRGGDGQSGDRVPPLPCPSAELIAGALRREGLTVHVGSVVSVPHVVRGAERARLAAQGHLCADMESAWLLEGAGDRPRACVRVIADPSPGALIRPATLRHVRRALRVLPAVGRVLARWSTVLDARHVLLAAPRSFCAGVERAIEVVERTLEQHGPPVYVRKQIVHNVHVVEDLARRGAIFVEELDEVPRGAMVIFSAHGVSPAVRDAAVERGLEVVDATCPLVSKVHSEARRFAGGGNTVVLVGHAGHEETEGTMGEVPDRTVLVQDRDDARSVRVEDPSKVAYLVQTTLASDEVSEVVEVLRERFPDLRSPPSADICYATTNRQQALREVAERVDLVLVIGSENSSNSRRLVEVARREGTPAYLIDDVGDIDLGWLAGAETVGVTAGASAPPELVDQVRDALRGLGPVEATEHSVTTEDVHFMLPKEVRHA